MVMSQVPAQVVVPMGDGLALCLERQLSEWARVKAKEELRESDETAPAAIVEVRRLILEEEGLTVPMDDEFLTAALRTCHWYPDSTVERLKRYFRFKTKNHKISRNLLPSCMEHVIRSNIITILPKRDQHGRRVLLMQTGKRWDVSKVPIDDLLRSAIMWLEMALIEPDTQVAGSVLLWDVDGLSMSHVLRFTPSFAKMMLYFIQECMPLRLKAVHFVKHTSLFDIGYAVFKQFLNEKYRPRVYFHGFDPNSLAKHFDMNMIPMEYGGSLPMKLPTAEDLLVQLPLFENYFAELSKYGYKKSKK